MAIVSSCRRQFERGSNRFKAFMKSDVSLDTFDHLPFRLAPLHYLPLCYTSIFNFFHSGILPLFQHGRKWTSNAESPSISTLETCHSAPHTCNKSSQQPYIENFSNSLPICASMHHSVYNSHNTCTPMRSTTVCRSLPLHQFLPPSPRNPTRSLYRSV